MIELVNLFLMLLVVAVIFGLLYWAAVAISGLFPPPVANTVRVVLTVLLILMAVMALISVFGYGPAHLHFIR